MCLSPRSCGLGDGIEATLGLGTWLQMPASPGSTGDQEACHFQRGPQSLRRMCCKKDCAPWDLCTLLAATF